MKRYSIIVKFNKITSEEQMHECARQVIQTYEYVSVGSKIECYGCPCAGKTRNGSDATGYFAYVMSIEASDDDDLIRRLDLLNDYTGNFASICDNAADDRYEGKPFWNMTLQQCVKMMGDRYKVPYVFYPGREQRKEFTSGDKKSVTFIYSDSIVRDVVSRITADLGGASADFTVEPGDVKVDVTGDGKVRLGFYVRMKTGKKDYGDIGLQSRLNDVRKTIAFKYGLDVDVVDIRSTIEYA